MKFIPYTSREILDYYDNINCLKDVQVIADYLNENKSDYTPGEYEMLRRLIYVYVDLFV